MTLDDYINEAKAKVISAFAKPQEPDWALDQDVRRYNSAIEVLHRALEVAERDARASYSTALLKSKKKGQ